MFVSSKPGYYGEDRKADIKNHNLPILQHMYMGSRETPLECLITGTPAFIQVPDFASGKSKVRFRLDFNHIRQRTTDHVHPGTSVDKQTTPSAIFRETRFDDRASKSHLALFEFMCIIPVCTEYHSYISQDSSKNDLTLANYHPKSWPWALRTKKNYTEFTKAYGIDGIPYDQFIDHLSDIDQPPIYRRLEYTWDPRGYAFINE